MPTIVELEKSIPYPTVQPMQEFGQTSNQSFKNIIVNCSNLEPPSKTSEFNPSFLKTLSKAMKSVD
jgi:hypothetical protein